MSIQQEIINERKRQDEIWGVQDHHPLFWLGIIGEEYGEMCKSVIENVSKTVHWDDYRKELIHLTASCVAAIENLDKMKREMKSTVTQAEEGYPQ